MASLNKVMLIGNVTADPEIRYLEGDSAQNSVKVASVRLATNERYRDRKTGEWKEVTEFHRISAWGGNAETIERYVRKGTPLYVEGRIRTRSWTDRDNNARSAVEILAESVLLLGRKSDNPASTPLPTGVQPQQPGKYSQPQGQQPQQPAHPQPAPQPTVVPPPIDDPDDDLPF